MANKGMTFYIAAIIASASGCSLCPPAEKCVCECGDETVSTSAERSSKAPSGFMSAEEECAFLNVQIAESMSFAERMKRSRYAVHYRAISRQQIADYRRRSAEIKCRLKDRQEP